MSAALADVLRVYQGSNGDATRALYVRLEALGAAGTIAVNLFRAQKSSERAKVYRGGGYRGMAYDRKQWSLDNLCTALAEHAAALGIEWGWGEDSETIGFTQVLYVELPTGQVSFHAPTRGTGPDHARPWDGRKGQSPDRIIRFVARLLDGHELREGAA
jgi:hypothetical protein